MADFFAKGNKPINGYGGGNLASKSDLTDIFESGTTASQAIGAGKYFYLNGELCRAKTSIASGATFTLNTNYETITDGALNDLAKNKFVTSVALTDNVNYQCQEDGYFHVQIANGTSNYCYQYVNRTLLWGGMYVNNSSNAQIHNSIFVKKGMEIYFHGSGATGTFIPLTL